MTTANTSTLPTRVSNNLQVDQHGDNYGNLFLTPYTPMQNAAVEGTYYQGVNALPATAITSSIATAYSTTASAFFALRNTDTTGGKSLYLDFIELQTLVAPASATEYQCVVDVDNVLTRFTSGGTAITPTNTNTNIGTTSIALLNAGALLTVALGGGGRNYGQTKLRTVIPVVGDSYILTFGQSTPMSSALIGGTGPYLSTYQFQPVIVGPQGCMCLSLFGAGYAATAATYFFRMGWVER